MESLFYEHAGLPKSITSSWDKFPTESNPKSLYKFFSMELISSLNLKQINRQTYSILDWMGDCGGLFDALLIIGQIFVQPF